MVLRSYFRYGRTLLFVLGIVIRHFRVAQTYKID